MRTLPASYLPLILGVIVFGAPACSKKSVQSGGSHALQEEMARGDMAKGKDGGASATFPDTSLSGRDSSNSLRGLDRNPSEERLGGSSGSSGNNTVIARSDPGNLARQLEEIRAEQVASAAAGLRDVFFGYDSFSITDEGRQALSNDVEWVRANPATQIKIEGHCDERGTSAYNLVLGEKRAKAVRNYMVELGIAPDHLSVISYGKERPFCTEHTESCHSQNRRGHIVVKTGR